MKIEDLWMSLRSVILMIGFFNRQNTLNLQSGSCNIVSEKQDKNHSQYASGKKAHCA
jgi:hypothetical protein